MMARGFLIWLVIFAIISAFIFGWRAISRQEVAIAGKLTVAGILSALVSGGIYFLEFHTN